MVSQQPPSTNMKGPIKFVHHNEVDSTHSWLEKNYCEIEESHPRGLTVISADNQTGGRGTGNRQWVCPPGKGHLVTYYFTIPGSLRAQAASFLQVAAQSVICTLANRVCSGMLDPNGKALNFQLKWPNDIMVNGRKIGGMMSRMVNASSANETAGLILSVGLNVNTEERYFEEIRGQHSVPLAAGLGEAVKAELPNEGRPNFFVWQPTSIKAALGNPFMNFDIPLVREAVATDLWETIEKFTKAGEQNPGVHNSAYQYFRGNINKVMMLRGEKITFAPHGREHAERVKGILGGLDDEGWIMISDEATGTEQKYCSGELCYE